MAPDLCSEHPAQTIQWRCATCGAPLCEACGAGALEGKIYCPKCLPDAKPAAVPTPQNADKGLGLGIGLSLLSFFLLPIALWGVLPLARNAVGRVVGFPSVIRSLLFLVANPLVLIPIAALIARRRGKRGLAKGLIIGLIISVSLTVLLAAACFGLIFVLSKSWK